MLAARTIVKSSKTPEQAYDRLVTLYAAQPRLASRTMDTAAINRVRRYDPVQEQAICDPGHYLIRSKMRVTANLNSHPQASA